MSETSKTKLVTPASLAVDLVLCVAFFSIIFSLVSSHVPSHDSAIVLLIGGATTTCMTVVFWLAVQMFRVVLRAQREAKVRQ